VNLNLGELTYNNNPNKIILHHAESSNCTIEDINQWHKGNGWSGVGYHYFIRKDGTIYKGRPEEAQGAQCSGQNTESIGICFEGAYMTETMPQEQFNSGAKLIADIRNRRGSLPIGGHREYYSTDCPGTNFPLEKFKGGSYIVPINLSSNTNISTSLLDKAKEYVGTRCRDLQEKLISKGYDCGGYGTDGVFGEGTLKSLLQFQRDNRLEADGLAGDCTFTKLNYVAVAATVQTNGDELVRLLQQECINQGFSSQSVDGIPGPDTLNGCPTLEQGSKGEITRCLQKLLNRNGYNLSTDGDFGGNTSNAVLNFQGVTGLSQDGVVGQQTWSKLLGL
jgi:peptidoglycan hydrolase-like protein with peptidoglycan-binding domain